MAQTNISIRIDESIKKQFDEFCEEIGMNMTTAINIFIKRVLREQRIPFALSISDYNKETQNAIEDAENGIGLSKVYNNIDELFEDLDNAWFKVYIKVWKRLQAD